MNDNSPGQITTKASQGKPEGRLPGILRAVALSVLLIGATGSLVIMLREGQDTPRFLLILFTIWVLSPFAALFWANMVSKHWSVVVRAALYCVMLIVALGSLAIYSELIDVRPARSANAFLFVAVPPLSLLFVAIIIPMAAFLSGRLSRRDASN